MSPAAIRPPVELALGESFEWVSSFASRDPADGWACSVYFRGPEEVDLAGVVEGGAFSFTVSSSTFRRAGAFQWQAIATKTGPPAERVVVDGGRIWLLANLEETTNLGDQATHAERMVSRLEAALEGTADRNVLSYTIAGRSIERIPIGELESMLARYRRRMRTEKRLAAAGLEDAPRVVRTRLR